MKDEAFTVMLDDKDPDFELVYLGSGNAGRMDVFTVYRRSDGEKVGQVRFDRDTTRMIRFDIEGDIESPCPFYCGNDADDREQYAPAWDTRVGFVESFEKYPFTSGRW